jgi:hypothetical protein
LVWFGFGLGHYIHIWRNFLTFQASTDSTLAAFPPCVREVTGSNLGQDNNFFLC